MREKRDADDGNDDDEEEEEKKAKVEVEERFLGVH